MLHVLRLHALATILYKFVFNYSFKINLTVINKVVILINSSVYLQVRFIEVWDSNDLI